MFHRTVFVIQSSLCVRRGCVDQDCFQVPGTVNGLVQEPELGPPEVRRWLLPPRPLYLRGPPSYFLTTRLGFDSDGSRTDSGVTVVDGTESGTGVRVVGL